MTAAMVRFEALALPAVDRDEFDRMPGKTVFTTTAWLRYLEEAYQGRAVVIRITEEGRLLGYFSGVVKTILGVRIFGSPFKGWGTCFMGFDLIEPRLIPEVCPGLAEFIFRSLRCHFLEWVDRNLETVPLPDRRLRFRMVETLELSIDKSDEELFKGFAGDCRNFLRQFERRGATIEIAAPDDAFAETYHRQLTDVFRKQGLVPSQSLDKIKRLLGAVGPSGMLLCLRANAPGAGCIASSIFLGRGDKFFFWGGASFREHQHYRPNEYMIWTAIRYWRDLGAKVFDMVGVRDYKAKFGAERREYVQAVGARRPGLVFARDVAERTFFWSLGVRGRLVSGRKGAPLQQGHLRIREVLDQEIAHFADGEMEIFSKFNKVRIKRRGQEAVTLRLPLKPWHRVFGWHRLLRRLSRLDKCFVVPTSTGFVIFWQEAVYHAPLDGAVLRKVLDTPTCRNPLHGSVAVVDGRELFFGEYGRPNAAGKAVNRSRDGGICWEKCFTVPAEKARHIHACKWDPFEAKVWVLTGDFDGQAHVLCADRDFTTVEWIGDGSQVYRAVDAVFERDAVHWIMDSPLVDVRHVRLDRKSRAIRLGTAFPGPVWYLKRLTDGITLACTVQEIGPAHKDEFVHVFASRNMSKWTEVGKFRHDRWKKGTMKFGVGAFADGAQDSRAFYMHFEAVRGLDGRTALCELTGI
jgi:hypothetical protein